MTPNQLLDAVREGQDYSYEQITEALIATGDAAGWYDLDGGMAQAVRSQGMDEALERPAERQGDAVGESVVVKDDQRHQRDPRPWCSAYLASRNETTSI